MKSSHTNWFQAAFFYLFYLHLNISKLFGVYFYLKTPIVNLIVKDCEYLNDDYFEMGFLLCEETKKPKDCEGHIDKPNISDKETLVKHLNSKAGSLNIYGRHYAPEIYLNGDLLCITIKK